MWELARPTSRGGLSARRILTYALATIVAAFLWVLFTSPAVSAADASWEGASIRYEGNQYIQAGVSKPGESHGIPADSTYYTHVKTVSERPLKQEAFVLYFAPGLDPPNATSATYVVYDYNDRTFSNARDQRSVAIEPTTATQPATTCAIEGIGWAVCQLSTFLAGGMDYIFQLISGFMEVQPATVDNSGSSLYIAWNVVRGIANVAFIIAFLFIIYSQISNLGISNYGIKKLLPRLIIAAILVNISYFICAIAIDLSNVIAYSIQDVMMGLRDTLFDNGTNSGAAEAILSWESITGFILSGGTAALAGGIGIGTALLATGGDVIGLVFILLPTLLALVLAVLVVLVILAARQAIITILLIISPLAFVAFLLPNTEKWFEKWRDLFFTMLIFFPAFALVFGGSQVAGTVIIMNANSINVMLLGMIVQVAPLVITPLLLKLSGGLLGRIAGLVNDPRKGLVDRTRNWANAHAEARKYNKIGGEIKSWDLAGRAARNLEYRKHRISRRTEAGKAGFEAYSKKMDYTTRRGLGNEILASNNKYAAEELDADFTRAAEEMRAGDSSGIERLRMHGDVRLGERIGMAATGEARDQYLQRKRIADNKSFNKMAAMAVQRAAELDRTARITADGTQSAKIVQQNRYAEFLSTNEAGRIAAAGIDTANDKGLTRILSNAKAQIEAEKDNLVKNIKIASSVKPGDAEGLAREFRAAVEKGNAEAMRAYADLLAEAANPGVVALRKVIADTESVMPVDAMEELKAHINASAPINAAAEDIASWSRDEKSRSIRLVAEDKKTWEGLTATSFSGMKKSSQEAALRTGAISQKTAQAILGGPAFQNLKPDMQERIEKLANGQNYTYGIEDPFK